MVKNKVDACMFCGNAPCTCNAKPKAAPKPKAKIVKDAPAPVVGTVAHEAVELFVQSTPKPSPFANMGFVNPSEALRREALGVEPEPVVEQQPVEVDPFQEALKVISFARILAPHEQKRIDGMIEWERDPAADKRRTEWRRRNAR